ncbi:trypsin-like peptidase domain-containing protein [Bacillus sp. V3B]|uniref:S1C family serine protease n=1 Tax=Bacillus sp. V3B TaxID=2804915 RepID=UPI00210B76CE|nr:trypsin-like peptidase domain-containing protein [Bacillus sp. V3B]MCQ6273962.1 trypsin-like peptidase domain-containing protein [Bacillus sp. V3B]
MNDYNGHTPNSIEAPKKQRRQGKSRLKGFMKTIAGGIIGSALTLTIIPHTDYMEVLFSAVENKVAQISGQTENNSISSGEITAQKTATSTSDATTSVADMVDEASKSIVGIVNMQTQTQGYFFPNLNTNRSNVVESGSGTGVVFKIDGNSAYIVTNNHVVEDAQEIHITVYGGEETTAELIGTDPLTDTAVLKIDAKYATSVLEFGDSSSLRAGDTVLAIGNPLGLDLSNTVTQGIVSAVDRTVAVSTSAGNWDLNVIQTDAAINPGNSGGALVNLSGQLIGMNSLKISEDGVEGLGFAIPSNDLVPIINEMIENGRVDRPYIGVGLASLEQIPQTYVQNLPNSVEGGAIVKNIDPNSAAAKSGLQVQDVIVSINDTNVKSSDELRKYLYTELEVGDKAIFKIYRGSEQMTIELTLTSSSSSN